MSRLNGTTSFGIGIARPAPTLDYAAPRRGAESLSEVRWIIGFLVLEFICQLALLVPSLSPLRVLLRSAAFGASLIMLGQAPGRARRPAAGEGACQGS